MADDGKILASDFIEGDKIVAELERVDKKISDVIASMARLVNQGGNFSTSSQANSILNTRVKLETDASAVIKERARLQNALLRQQARANQASSDAAKALAKQRLENQLLTREQKKQLELQSGYTTELRKAKIIRDGLAKTIQDLLVKQRLGNKLTKEEIALLKQSTIQHQKYKAAVENAERTVGNFSGNVGNYKSALGGLVGLFKQLVGTVTLIEGLRLGIRFGKDAVELAKQAKGVEFAFDRLGDSGEDAFKRIRTSSRGLLAELDIKQALVELDNFNISLGETDTLMEFLLVRSAQTGRSVDSLRDSLVEGLSKESKLRIDNLGISTAELNSELKKTPNFVEAVANIAKREIKDAGNILDEAANSTEAWNSAWKNLELNIGKAFEHIKGIGFFTDSIQTLSDMQAALNESWDQGGGYLDRLEIQMNTFTEAGREANRVFVEQAIAARQNAKAIQEQINAYVQMYGAIGPLTQKQLLGGSSVSNTPFPLRVPEETPRLLADINNELDKLNNELDEGQFSTREEASAIQDQITALEAERDAILGVAKAKEKTQEVIAGTILSYEKQIEALEKFIKTEATSTEAIKKAQLEITQLQGQIEQLRRGNDVLVKVKLDIERQGRVNTDLDEDILSNYGERVLTGLEESGFDLSGPLDELERFNEARKNGEEAYTQFLKEQKDKQAAIVADAFEEFSLQYGLDASKFAALLDSKENTFADYVDAVGELGELIYSLNAERYAADYENAKAALDKTLDDETKSEEQKAAAKAKFRKEEAKIKKKQFEADKQAALLNIAISTAVSLIRLWEKPGFPGAIPLTVLVGGLGIAQAAVVASKKPPKFFKGTENAPLGWAWTDEKGAEIHTDKRGRIKDWGTEKGPRLKWLERGDKIYTAEKSKNLIADYGIDVQRKLVGQVFIDHHNQRLAYSRQRERKDDRLLNEVAALRREMRRYADRPIEVTAKVEQEFNQY